jgi:hypothetical protein
MWGMSKDIPHFYFWAAGRNGIPVNIHGLSATARFLLNFEIEHPESFS